MMRREAQLEYAKDDYYQAVEVPYDNCEISMLILFPESDRFETIQRSLDTGLVNSVLMKLKNEDIGLVMPKFEFSSSFNLRSALTTMGMGLAFSDKADFSGMTGSNDLFLSDMLHRSFVSVGEAGTEAAAATASVLGTGRSARVHEVTIDAPFIFLIRDVRTGSIFFIGRVTNPLL
jgi:serpin B